MSAPLRIGLVGRGPWGEKVRATLARRTDAVLAGIAGRDWERLAGEKFDGMIVATPPQFHLPIARRFGELGVALLIEKPLCLDLAEALAFRDCALRFRAPVLVDHIHLFSRAYRLLKALSPKLGRVTGIVSAGGRNAPARPDTPPLWDWGPHDVAMALDLMGAEPETVAGRRSAHIRTSAGRWEVYVLDLGFAGGVRARATVGNALDPVRRFEAVHERGTLVYDDLAARKLEYLPGSHPPVAEVSRAIDCATPFGPPLDCVVEEFCAAIRTGRPDLRQLDLALAVVRILEQLTKELGE